MKHPIIPLFAFAIHLSASAAVPLRWTVETSRATPAQFEAYQGETLTFEATLQSDGKPLAAPADYAFFWQTNGMGNAHWEAPARPVPASSLAGASTNVLFATWLPAYDVGARAYNCFIGSPSNIYHAAFQLRLRPSPGATPNALPLPTPVIDFAKVRVLNPPWESGGGVHTNTVREIVKPMIADAANAATNYTDAATNAIRRVDGASAIKIAQYLFEKSFDDPYPDDAAWYYSQQSGEPVGCSAVRDGGFLYRNFDFPFDDRAEFVVHMSSGPVRFASVGVAQVGTNLTEAIVTSGKPSRYYKALPGATVDGINENGVVAEINVVDGNPQTSGWHTGGDIHPLGAVRWALDNGTSASMVASNLAERISFPAGWAQNYHYMIADEAATYIVENGTNYLVTGKAVMTNFRLYPSRDTTGAGQERYDLLSDDESITNAWFTLAYSRGTNPPWFSEFGNNYEYLNAALNLWNDGRTKEQHRGESYTQTTYPYETITWWQTVHTSIYDITNRTLRIAVQERDDWYVFALARSGTDEAKVREIATDVAAPMTNGIPESIHTIELSKRDKTDMVVYKEGWNFQRLYDKAHGYNSVRFEYYDPKTEDRYRVNPDDLEVGDYMIAIEQHSGFEEDVLMFKCNVYPTTHEPFFEVTRVLSSRYADFIGWVVNKDGIEPISDRLATESGVDSAIAAHTPGNYAVVSNAAMTAKEYADTATNVVWRLEAEGGRFFFKPVRPINMED